MFSPPANTVSSTSSSIPYRTPAPKKGEDYADYDLSPPKLKPSKQRTFEEAVKAINKDYEKLRVKGVEEGGKRKMSWMRRQNDGSNVPYQLESCRILLFLYSRNFMKHGSKGDRVQQVKKMLKGGCARRVILQIIDCTGDRCLSCHEKYQAQYIRFCLTIHRYFQQDRAAGFKADMSAVTLYLRHQKEGSCFIQAACVAMSYLLQACGVDEAPTNASRLIRHHFDDQQLIQYIKDDGGDSLAIFKILEKKFFDYHAKHREPDSYRTHRMQNEEYIGRVIEELNRGPGLVSKFVVPKAFECSPPSKKLKESFPALAHYTKWNEIPDDVLPSGVVRFTTWNEPAEFVPFETPVDTKLQEKETLLKAKWTQILRCQGEQRDGDLSTTLTASMSSEYGSGSDSLETPSERSAPGTTSTFEDDDSDEENWSSICDVDDLDHDGGSCGPDEDNETGEGADYTKLHAMVLLGFRQDKDGSVYWLLQNSWAGPMQVIEVSTAYLQASGAFLYFFDLRERSPKPKCEWEKLKAAGLLCSAPVAESCPLERNDCEDWWEGLIYPRLQEEEVSDDDDDSLCYYDI